MRFHDPSKCFLLDLQDDDDSENDGDEGLGTAALLGPPIEEDRADAAAVSEPEHPSPTLLGLQLLTCSAVFRIMYLRVMTTNQKVMRRMMTIMMRMSQTRNARKQKKKMMMMKKTRMKTTRMSEDIGMTLPCFCMCF